MNKKISWRRYNATKSVLEDLEIRLFGYDFYILVENDYSNFYPDFEIKAKAKAYYNTAYLPESMDKTEFKNKLALAQRLAKSFTFNGYKANEINVSRF